MCYPGDNGRVAVNNDVGMYLFACKRDKKNVNANVTKENVDEEDGVVVTN